MAEAGVVGPDDAEKRSLLNTIDRFKVGSQPPSVVMLSS